ncbi:MAG: hypothetical protein ACE5Z5_10735 [Candidatus Bathyarchaeia archaeon]
MNVVTTPVGKIYPAYRILKEVPEGSVVILPECVYVKKDKVEKISRQRGLFVVFNIDPYIENCGVYNAMLGMEKGEIVWRVRKFYLWENEIRDKPPRWEGIVDIRGKKTAIVICYEISKVGRAGKLFSLGREIAEHKSQLLLMPANWHFAWSIPSGVISLAMKLVDSLEACAFACTKQYAMITDRLQSKKIRKYGWDYVEL